MSTILVSQVIHFLELVTITLTVALAVQLFRCYRSFEQSLAAPKAAVTPLSVSEQEVEKHSEFIEVKEHVASTSASPIQEKVAAPAASDDILTDYIGGFFDAPASTPDISEYKAPAPARVVEMPLADAQPLEEAASEELDDLIITVQEEEAQAGHESVMSERVVHAMLDEAKLVCNS